MTTLVFDTSPVSAFARAGRLDALRTLVETHACRVTRAVLEEIDRGVSRYPALSAVRDQKWLVEVRGDSLEELTAFAELKRRFGPGGRDVGEAATLAWAMVNGAVAILDDGDARAVAREHSLAFKGTIGIVAGGVRCEVLGEADAVRLVDDLLAGGARLPCNGDQLMRFCRGHGLL